MTTRGDTAVIVLAAGAGTRMRSDVPKVLHTLAGPQHARARPARGGEGRRRGTWWSSSARTASASSRPSPSLADELGRPIDVAVQDEQLGTGHAVGCGLAALPDDFDGTVVVTAGDVPLLDADTLAGLVDAHGAEPAAATLLTTTLPDPTGYGRILRTQDGEVIEHRRAGRRHAVAAGDPRGQRRRLRVRRRRAALGAEPSCAPTTPSASCTSPTPSRSSAATVSGCAPGTSTTARWSRASTTASSSPICTASSTGASSPPMQRSGVTVIDPATTWIDVDVDRRPRHRRRTRAPSCSAPRAIGARCQIGPDTTLTGVTVGDGAIGDPHAGLVGGDRRRRRRRPVRLPAAGHRARAPRARSARSSRPRTRPSARAPRCRT